jgi:hypothetical protein
MSGLSNKLKEKKFRDPFTGDKLTLGEKISWQIQTILRRWIFIVIITIGTITCWMDGSTQVLLWWNLVASYMALFIESVVGIAMFAQTRRDAMIIREVHKYEKEDSRVHEKDLSINFYNSELLEETQKTVSELKGELSSIKELILNSNNVKPTS